MACLKATPQMNALRHHQFCLYPEFHQRDVRGVVKEGAFSGSIFILEINDPSIESKVQTLNLPQLLK